MPASNRKKKTKRKLRNIHKLILSVLAIFALAFGINAYSRYKASACQAGIKYLKEQDASSIDDLNDRLAALREEERQALLVKGPVKLYPCFNNSLILGDSRSEGFVSNGFMSSTVNLSVLSTDITYIPYQLETVGNVKPEVIYFCYGTNDVYRNIGGELGGEFGEGFADLLEQYVDMVLEVSPKSKIAINSFIPCSKIHTPDGYEDYCAVIDLYNKHIRELCEKRKWIYIDNDALFDKWGEDCFVSDGTHFVSEFFDPWAINMITTVYPEYEEAEWY